MQTPTPAPSCWKVRHFSASASRASKGGIRVSYFATETEATAFAATQTLYARPARAEPVALLTPSQQLIANAATFGAGQ